MYSNHVIMGRLGKAPELRYLPTSGEAVCNISVAVDVGYGEHQRTEWYQVSVFGPSAEAVNQYCDVGSIVLVYGDDLKASAYKSRQGEARASLQLISRRVVFAGVQSDAEPDAGQGEVGEIPF